MASNVLYVLLIVVAIATAVLWHSNRDPRVASNASTGTPLSK